MQLTKSQKIWIGILTFMPILCLLGYLATFLFMFTCILSDIDSSNNKMPEQFPVYFVFLFIFLGLSMISSLASLVLHILHVTKNQKLKEQNNGQLIWILIIILANGIGGIIYYFVEVLPEPKSTDTQKEAITP